MSCFLFVDESGQDHRHSPYEVLAGAVIHDTQLWNLIQDIADLRRVCFGTTRLDRQAELKAREILKPKTFRLANQMAPIPPDERRRLAAELLAEPTQPSRRKLTSLAQAKIDYASQMLELCARHDVRLFAAIVTPQAPRPSGQTLRKDYAYLFERFFYFVDEQSAHERGCIVFDERDHTQSWKLMHQMAAYFRDTATGRMRSGRIIPEPFFVHSDLTTGVQIADFAAYVIAWNVRVGSMIGERRVELQALGEQILQLRHRAVVERQGYPQGFSVWSFAVIDDLRP